MKIKEWMLAAALAVIGAAVLWGSTQTTVGTIKDDVRDLKTWKDTAIQQMANMDGKLDALLRDRGIRYRPRGGK